MKKEIDLDSILNRIELRYITMALKECNYHRGKAAKMLGVKRTTFVMRMKRHGILSEMPSPASTRDRITCMKGHPLDPNNTYLIKTKTRTYKRCKLCVRERYEKSVRDNEPMVRDNEPLNLA